MKVVLVSNTIPPDKMGGLPRYVRELGTALAKAGCETIVLAKRADSEAPRIEDAPDGVRIIRHSVPSKRNPFFAPAYPFYSAYGVLAPLQGAQGPDTIVHAHFPVTALPLVLSSVDYLYTFHAPVWRELLDEHQGTYALPSPVQGIAVAGLRATERLVVRRATRTFVLSEFMRGQMADLDAGVAARTQLLPGGIDIDRFCPDPSVARVGVDAPLLFTARRLTPRTGVDRLVRAMPDVMRVHPNATLVVVGTGEMDHQLRRLASELGVSEHIRFLGSVSDKSLVDFYRRATLVVMPTVRLEGFGLTTAEALACGTPVVGTPVGAIPELLEPLDRSLISADPTPHGLAETINQVLRDAGRLASIADRCRARVAPTMGWDAIAQRYLEVYERMLPTS